MSDVSKVFIPPMASNSTKSTGRNQTHAAPMSISARPIMQARKPSITGMSWTAAPRRPFQPWRTPHTGNRVGVE
jgi:hypothetical protein